MAEEESVDKALEELSLAVEESAGAQEPQAASAGPAPAKGGGKYGLKGKSPAKKMLPKHLLGGQAAQDVNRPKPNSTSSLYILSTLQNPNQDELVLCIAKALHNKVKEGHLEGYKTRVEDEIFNEQLHPINNDKIDVKKVPTFDLVFDFLNSIFRAERLAPECLVMCLAYMDRLLQSTTIRMHASNWRRLVLSALILASKVWEDQAVWNIDFLSVFPLVSVKDLNNLERKFLEVLNYNVGMKASEYAKYYFDLRESSTEGKFESVKPLTTEQAAKLEQNSLGISEKAGGKQLKRTMSAEQLRKDSKPVILN